MNGHLRHDLRSLALNQEAVRVLRAHPEVAARALECSCAGRQGEDRQPLWDEWHRIIEDQLWDLAVEESDRGQQLRQASPLSFVLTEDHRSAILHRFRYARS